MVLLQVIFSKYLVTYVLCQCREEGAYALENASESREVEPISSDLRSEATEEEGIHTGLPYN